MRPVVVLLLFISSNPDPPDMALWTANLFFSIPPWHRPICNKKKLQHVRNFFFHYARPPNAWTTARRVCGVKKNQVRSSIESIFWALRSILIWNSFVLHDRVDQSRWARISSWDNGVRLSMSRPRASSAARAWSGTSRLFNSGAMESSTTKKKKKNQHKA